MAEKGGIQLLPETRKSIEIKTPGENKFLYIGGILVVVVAGMYLGLRVYIGSLEERIGEIQMELAQLEDELDTTMRGAIEATAKRATLVSGILDNHTYITQAIEKLSDNMQEKIRVKTLAVNVAGSRIDITIDAGSYTAIAKFLATLNADDGVKDIKIGGIKPANNGVLESAMNIEVDSQKYFLKK